MKARNSILQISSYNTVDHNLLKIPSLRLTQIILPFIVFVFCTAFTLDAQVILTLDYKVKTPAPTSVKSGEYWAMQLDYAISSTTSPNISGVKIEIPLPDLIENVTGFIGTSHAPASNFVFTNTPGSKKLTINFINPVPTGSSGVLEFKMRTMNGATPDGTVINTCATLTDGAGNTSGPKCSTMPITAQNLLCGNKSLKSGGAVGAPTTYRIVLGYSDPTYPGIAPLGVLNASNISITDTYPAGATYISAQVVNESGTVVPSSITQSGNTVTATISNYIHAASGSTGWGVDYRILEVTVQYNAPPFSIGQSVTNMATVTLTPLGQSPVTLVNGSSNAHCTSDLIETHTLQDIQRTATLTKMQEYNSAPNVSGGVNFSYNFDFTNTGNVALNNVEIIETVPADLTYYGLRMDAWGNEIIGMQYQTNQNAIWTNWPSPTQSGNPPPPLAAGEKVTLIKWILVTPFNSMASLGGTNLISFTAGTVAVPTPITNCMEWNATDPGLPLNRQACNSFFTVIPPATTASVAYGAFNSPSCASPHVFGTEMTISGQIIANTGYVSIQNPVVGFLVRNGAQYVPGSQTFDASISGISGTPTFTLTPNHRTISGVSYDLFRWTFPVGTVVPPGTNFWISAKVILTNLLPPDQAVEFQLMVDGSNISEYYAFQNAGFIFVDSQDWDGDGNTTETVRTANSGFNSCTTWIAASAEMESIKWVKGQLDTEFSRYPQSGETVQGGLADYRLVVKNKGNVTMKDIVVIDILPFVGDMGVIDLSPRNSAWRPNLANPIIAPAGVTVYYSTAQNPCRDEMKAPLDPSPFPSGCTAANWTLAPFPDITGVQSLKFDFGSIQVEPGDSLVLTWPMRAPTDAPTNGEIAWNSFGFVATRTDNNQPLLAAEPIKVGIKVFEAEPGIYGDYVWIDTNMDGLQNEVGTGVSGVRVDFYRDNGDGISNPLTDEYVGFTVTDLDGKYLFPNLIPADYFAVFFPPAGYVPTLTDQGTNDALDSDGIIMPVTTIDPGEDDRTWDLGLFLAPACDINISYVSVSPCRWNGLTSEVVVNAYITWANAPSGQNIIVSVNGINDTIDVVGGAQQMAFVTFVLPADNTSYIINACFANGSTCCDQRILQPVNGCNPDQCYSTVTANPGVCVSAANQYTITGQVTLTNPPATGTVTVQIVGGGSQSFTLPQTSPISYSIAGQIADGASHTINVSISGVTCESTVNYLAPGPPTLACAKTDNTNCTIPNGSATATATGVTYLWSNGATTTTISNLMAGTYTVTVTSTATSCTNTCSVTLVNNTTNPTATCSKVDNTNCTVPNGSASVTTNAANPSYLWSNNATTSTITGLSAGTYTVTVTNIANGCTATCAAVVATTTTPPSVACSKVDNTNCIAPNGSATATATGVTYLWSNGATTATISNLMAGTYTVTVTSTTTSCTNTCSVTLVNNTTNPTANCSKVDNSNCTVPNGSASVTTDAANPSYLWSNNATTSTITGLSAGTYTVTVTNTANGCTATCAAVVATTTTPPSVACSKVDNTNCTAANGSATATATGVTYLWNTGATTATINNLAAGTYTVTVTSTTTSCTNTCSVTLLNNTTNPTATCSKVDNTNCAVPNGSASVTTNAANPSYLWSNNATTSTITGLSAGTYTVTVTNTANGCTATCAAVVATTTTPPPVTCSKVDNTHCTAPNGTATATATSVTYLWSNGATTATISNLMAGTYTVTVTSTVTACTNTCAVNVINAQVLPSVTCTPLQPTCIAPSGGSIQANPTGGTAPYTYLWSNGQTGASLTGLTAGLYSVTITDANGCSSNCSSTLNAPTGCCEIVDLGLIIGTCDNKGTLSNANDDEYTFTLNPTGTGIGTSYTVNGLPNSPQTGTYGSPTTFGPYLISASVLNISVVDNVSNTCSKTGSVSPPAPCSACNLSAPLLDVTDNVCPSRTGVITVIQNCGAGSFIQYSTNNGLTWSSVMPLYTTAPKTILARCVNSSDTICKSASVMVTTAPIKCSDGGQECSVIAAATVDPCQNNGTANQVADDYFTVQINASASKGGSSNRYEVVMGADLVTGLGGNVLNSGGTIYGSPVTVGQNKQFKADGITAYTLIVRDLNTKDCFQEVTISAVASCSGLPPKSPCYPVPCVPIDLKKN